MSKKKFAHDTSNRTFKDWAIGLSVLLMGLIIAHLGVTLFLLADLGVDTFTTFVKGISVTTSLSIGTCHVIICIVLMLVMFFTTKGYVKPGTVLCAFCGGWIIDLFNLILSPLINDNTVLLIRVLIMIVGCIILSFGMSIVINSNSGTGPNDLIAIIISDKLNKKHKVQFFFVRITVDILLVLFGFLLGSVPGVGTIIAVFLTGPLVQFFLPITEKLMPKSLI